MTRTEINPQEFFELATEPTTNEMFDNGAWMAPVLASLDPLIDPRAAHRIHYFAEETELSVCGQRFLPEHYIDAPRSKDEARQQCTTCSQIMVTASMERAPSSHMPLMVDTDVYSPEAFRKLLNEYNGTGRMPWQLNRLAVVEGDLYLMLDQGSTKTSSLRRTLKLVRQPYAEVILIETDRLQDMAPEILEEFNLRRSALQPAGEAVVEASPINKPAQLQGA